MMDLVIRRREKGALVYIMDSDRPIYCVEAHYSNGVNQIENAEWKAMRYTNENGIRITRKIDEFENYERVQLPDDSSVLF